MLDLPHSLQLRAAKLYERHASQLVPGIRFLLVIALGWTLAQLLWALLPTPQASQWQPAPVAATSGTAAARASGPDVNAILAAKLFGVYKPPTSASALSQAPDTRLSLTLLGILAGTDEHDSRALIGQQGGDEAPYAIGQDVISGVVLQAIFPDRVVLSRSGALETLRLDKDAPSKGVSPVTQSSDATNSSAQLAQIREQILQDPAKAADFIRVQPATGAGGTSKGYRIYPGKDRSLFSDAGLKPGDLVTSVNGIQLDDGQKALQTLNDLKGANNVALTIERGGQPQTVNITLSP